MRWAKDLTHVDARLSIDACVCQHDMDIEVTALSFFAAWAGAVSGCCQPTARHAEAVCPSEILRVAKVLRSSRQNDITTMVLFLSHSVASFRRFLGFMAVYVS